VSSLGTIKCFSNIKRGTPQQAALNHVYHNATNQQPIESACVRKHRQSNGAVGAQKTHGGSLIEFFYTQNCQILQKKTDRTAGNLPHGG
jgi:hypothetical protein